ncbi:MAG TPA: hypothetical protein PKN59_01795 [Syntrophales bacterium]|nr:hypothetical protein [Syntrophales bacterium]HNS53711.1 hypothetical protein [Syntrophales bacterium]
MKPSRWVIVSLLAMIIPGVAQAEDFIFTVPLKLNNLHSKVGMVRVFCQALNPSGVLIGGGHTIVPVGPTGNLSQNVIVAFNAEPNRIAGDASQYRCWFDMKAKEDSVYTQPKSATVPMYQAKPGTPFVPAVSGPIPRSATMSTPAPRAVPMTPR